MENRIPVICDRCRAEGVAGEAAFADLGDLLDFEPVPRKVRRVDGWTAEVQRAFIAALAVTGSERQAAHAVGKAQFGVDQLKKARGNEGFMAARERALAMAEEAKSRRLAAGLHAVTAPAARWRPPEPAWSRAATRQPKILPQLAGGGGPAKPVEGPARSAGELWRPAQSAGDAETPTPNPLLASVPPDSLLELEVTAEILRKYVLKLGSERRCRLQGRIAEADFYIRQVTMLEVALDVVTGNGMALLRDLRLGGHDLLQVAETDMSRQLDAARRAHWEQCGDPPRPEYPPRHLLVDHDGFATEPMPTTRGGLPESHEEQQRRIDEQFRQDAADHVTWEAAARQDYERRRASDAAS